MEFPPDADWQDVARIGRAPLLQGGCQLQVQVPVVSSGVGYEGGLHIMVGVAQADLSQVNGFPVTKLQRYDLRGKGKQ